MSMEEKPFIIIDDTIGLKHDCDCLNAKDSQIQLIKKFKKLTHIRGAKKSCLFPSSCLLYAKLVF